jgi:nicotinamide-nucleotide amidase
MFIDLELPDSQYFSELVRSGQFARRATEWSGDIADLAITREAVLCTAESCTGGWIAQQLTALAGSSEWFDSGLVTYSNAAKTGLLGVAAEQLQAGGPGAVSEETVLAMTAGAIRATAPRSDTAVAVSGVAGPGGGSAAKPVGTVWIAWQRRGMHCARCFQFAGDRQAVREATVLAALSGLSRILLRAD